MHLSKINDSLSTIVVLSLALALPLIFTPLTTEFYDTGKLIFIGLGILLLLLLWGFRLVTEPRLVLVKTPLDVLLVIYLSVVTLSTFLSPNFNVSLYGLIPRIHGGLISQIAVVLLYFLIVANVKKLKTIKQMINLLIGASVILSLVSLLSYFQFYLPFNLAKVTNFSLAGSSVATSLFLVMIIPLTLINLLHTSKNMSLLSIFYFIGMLLPITVIILIGSTPSWLITIFSILATIYFYLRANDKKLIVKGLFTPLMSLIVIVALGLAIFSYTPTVKDKTILGKLADSFQREIQLPFGVSWKIAASTFRDSPILGTGPGTFIYDFTNYKPIEFNRTNFWSVRFNSGFNQFLESWAEVGGAGVIMLLLVSSTFLFYSLKHKDQLGLGIAGISFILCMAFSPISFLVMATGFLLMALFMSTLNEGNQRSVDLPPAILLRSLLFLPIILAFLGGSFLLGKFFLGEIYHRQAVNALSKNQGIEAYNALIRAEKVNPNIDVYRVDLAQTSFLLANAIAAQKGPSEASPQGSLTDKDKSDIQTLLQLSIAEGKNATALSPRSAANWEILATIYRQISGVAQNATSFSLDAYGHAIQLDPLNPLLRLSVGGVYYQIKNYDLAVRFFDDVVSLKPDYANGLYNLAIALRDKGNTADAIRIAEGLVAQLQDKPDSQDYKTASGLLSELKNSSNKTASPTTENQPTALEQDNLPKVIDLPKPAKAATPAAVKKE